MAEKTSPASKHPAGDQPEGERIAKVLSRAGISSRREAERLIQLGEVTVNGRVIDSPALNVKPTDRITVMGKPVAAPEPARLWLYYKPEGLVTSESDEKGRDTVFANLPPELPRVMSVGRLDLNSEGLLLLTNDGELKRRLELPSTGWLRKYRVRVNGRPEDKHLDPLREGVVVDGEAFQPMQVTLDRQQGANAWLTVGLREGKNREIRRAMQAVGLVVNRLIRISYGPFRLNDLEPGAVEEVKPRILREQLGLDPMAEEEPEKPARRAPAGKSAPRATTGAKSTRSAAPSRSRDADDHRATAPKPATHRAAPRARPDDADDRRPAAKATSHRAATRGHGETASHSARPSAKPSTKPATRSVTHSSSSRPRSAEGDKPVTPRSHTSAARHKSTPHSGETHRSETQGSTARKGTSHSGTSHTDTSRAGTSHAGSHTGSAHTGTKHRSATSASHSAETRSHASKPATSRSAAAKPGTAKPPHAKPATTKHSGSHPTASKSGAAKTTSKPAAPRSPRPVGIAETPSDAPRKPRGRG